MAKRQNLREIVFDDQHTYIYDNGHSDKSQFLQSVQRWSGSDIDAQDRKRLTVQDVQHLRFKPMPPHEARRAGFDYGVRFADEGEGYPVTVVIL